MTEQRRLVAILVADVVGFSRLVGADESGTLARLAALRREIFDPNVTRHSGRLFKETGDGFLVEFASAVQAVTCAMAIQKAIGQTSLTLRIGIHVGDVVVQGDDLMGDGVNIAARLEGVAEPGGVAISGMVYDQVRDRLPYVFEDGGEQAMKNIARPVRVYRVQEEGAVSMARSADAPLTLPDKPSIAVLPFQNMSGDPEQEYFADGMTEDILTALSRFQNLFVIARNSSYTYKGRSVDIKQVGMELGVRYVLEGSVRAAANRVRITAQLIDASSGHHVWADRYDRALNDIFAIQDEVTSQIVATIDFEVRTVEAQRPGGSASAGLEAWTRYHKAFPLLFRLTEGENQRAATLFDDLRTSHPNLAVAHAGYGFARSSEVIYGWTADRAASARSAIAPCRKAVELDDKDAFCHLALGRALLLASDHELALAPIERAVARNPNSALAHLFRGVSLKGLDRDTEALAEIELAIRLSPRDPGLWSFYFWQGRCHRDLGDLDAAIRSLRQAIGERPDVWFPHLDLGTTLAKAGRIAEAKAAVTKAWALKPDLTLDAIAYLDSLFASPRRVDENQRLAAALGVPQSIVQVSTDAGSLALPDKPSIAVLPFQNMSGDPEQEYFADGMVEDIITALSRFRSLFVIARNSSFTYKGKIIDIKKVGRELGVRYVLEGSVRKAGGKVRITGQLIDSATGSHLWADRFDGDLADIFDLQDRTTESLVAAIQPSLQRAEIARTSAKPTENLDAYDLYLRGIERFYAKTKASSTKAMEFLHRAIKIDPEYAIAKGLLAHIYMVRNTLRWAEPGEVPIAIGLAREVIASSTDEPAALRTAGHALSDLARDYGQAQLALEKAVRISPNSAEVLTSAGWVHLHRGDPATAINSFQRAMRLSPLDPEIGFMAWGLGVGYLMAGRNADALQATRRSVQEIPNWGALHRWMAFALARLGRHEEAREAVMWSMEIDPGFRVSTRTAPFRDQAFNDEYAAALITSGAPE